MSSSHVIVRCHRQHSDGDTAASDAGDTAASDASDCVGACADSLHPHVLGVSLWLPFESPRFSPMSRGQARRAGVDVDVASAAAALAKASRAAAPAKPAPHSVPRAMSAAVGHAYAVEAAQGFCADADAVFAKLRDKAAKARELTRTHGVAAVARGRNAFEHVGVGRGGWVGMAMPSCTAVCTTRRPSCPDLRA